MRGRRALRAAFVRRRAEDLHDQAMALEDANEEQALVLYKRSLELDAQRPTTLYNIGLIYKYRRAWRESYEYNLRAFDLDPGNEATGWNLAIAATALGDWSMARRVWQLCGYEFDNTEGPIVSDFGLTPVRLNPDGEEPEVVWARRVDPVRARIESIPFSQSGYFFGDVVLHDGASQGYRMLGDSERPVFNVFERLERSGTATFWGPVTAPSQSDFDALAEACDQAGLRCEDWTSNIQYLCKQCSEGLPHEHHDQELPEPVWIPQHEVAFAAVHWDSLKPVLTEWSKGPGRLVGDLQTSG